jgi:hypothetical protein
MSVSRALMLGNGVNPSDLWHEYTGQAVAATQPAPQRQVDLVQARSDTQKRVATPGCTSSTATRVAQVCLMSCTVMADTRLGTARLETTIRVLPVSLAPRMTWPQTAIVICHREAVPSWMR